VVLASHLPDEQPFASAVHTVKHISCEDPFDYWRGIFNEWNTNATLVIVEHDMQVSDELINQLLADPNPLVTFAYQLFWVSTGKAAPEYAQRVSDFLPADVPPDRKYLGQAVHEGDMWADFSGLGLCKIAYGARCQTLTESSWQHLDIAVNAAIKGRWRVLWPAVNHHHV